MFRHAGQSEATVDDELRSRAVGRLVGGQEERDLRHLVRPSDPPQRERFEEALRVDVLELVVVLVLVIEK